MGRNGNKTENEKGKKKKELNEIRYMVLVKQIIFFTIQYDNNGKTNHIFSNKSYVGYHLVYII